VPKLLDLCSLYAHSNPAPLRRLLTDVFQLQPKYMHDLNGCVVTTIDNLNQMQRSTLQVSSSFPLTHGNPPNLSNPPNSSCFHSPKLEVGTQWMVFEP